jgi:hypothetical protein
VARALVCECAKSSSQLGLNASLHLGVHAEYRHGLRGCALAVAGFHWNQATCANGAKTYVQAWDAENRLASVTQGGSATTYTYNGDGQRAKFKVLALRPSLCYNTPISLRRRRHD